MEAASYSMPTNGRQMEKESVAHWKRASRSRRCGPGGEPAGEWPRRGTVPQVRWVRSWRR